MTTQLIIMPDGVHAREINPYGAEPIKYIGSSMLRLGMSTVAWNKWELAERSLKEYRIANCEKFAVSKSNGRVVWVYPNDVVTCEVNQEEGTCIIL